MYIYIRNDINSTNIEIGVLQSSGWGSEFVGDEFELENQGIFDPSPFFKKYTPKKCHDKYINGQKLLCQSV